MKGVTVTTKTVTIRLTSEAYAVLERSAAHHMETVTGYATRILHQNTLDMRGAFDLIDTDVPGDDL